MLKILIFFLLLLILPGNKTKSDNVTEQEKIASRLQLRNNVVETPGEYTITTANTVDNGRPDDIAGGKIFDQAKHEKNNNSPEILQRKSRYASKASRMECVSCYGSGISTSDENCYSGDTSKTVKCADAETCFTELHPQYIKRGCMLPTGTNRTFVCKCPLCNDKPSQDPSYYEYRTITDWKYDNERLTKPVVGLDLLCKVCETTGRSEAADNSCRNGSRTDYMLCGHKQLCYTNVDLQADSVTRGCIESPAYNSIHLLCNVSLCNNKIYENPARNQHDLIFRTMPVSKGFNSGTLVTPYACLTVLMLLLV